MRMKVTTSVIIFVIHIIVVHSKRCTLMKKRVHNKTKK